MDYVFNALAGRRLRLSRKNRVMLAMPHHVHDSSQTSSTTNIHEYIEHLRIATTEPKANVDDGTTFSQHPTMMAPA